MEYEKRPGWDWDLVFVNSDDGETIECRIFGVMTIRQVLDQAHVDAALPDEFEVIAIQRVPIDRGDGSSGEVAPHPPQPEHVSQ